MSVVAARDVECRNYVALLVRDNQIHVRRSNDNGKICTKNSCWALFKSQLIVGAGLQYPRESEKRLQCSHWVIRPCAPVIGHRFRDRGSHENRS
jgi:hypothetical protein